MQHIACAACGDEDGPFKAVDDTYLCEPCLDSIQDSQ